MIRKNSLINTSVDCQGVVIQTRSEAGVPVRIPVITAASLLPLMTGSTGEKGDLRTRPRDNSLWKTRSNKS